MIFLVKALNECVRRLTDDPMTAQLFIVEIGIVYVNPTETCAGQWPLTGNWIPLFRITR
jgi:hypothetical protein